MIPAWVVALLFAASALLLLRKMLATRRRYRRAPVKRLRWLFILGAALIRLSMCGVYAYFTLAAPDPELRSMLGRAALTALIGYEVFSSLVQRRMEGA